MDFEPGTVLKNGKSAPNFTSERAFVYSDGVFETIRVSESHVPLWAYHEARLKQAAQQLKLKIDFEFLPKLVDQILNESDCSSAILKLIVGRKSEPRGSYAIDNSGCDYFTQLLPARYREPEFKFELVSVASALTGNPNTIGLKLLNRLPYIVPTIEMPLSAQQEALFYSDEGCALEAMHHNLWALVGKNLITPALKEIGVHGVMRNYIKDKCADFNLNLSLRDLTKADLLQSDAVFLSNAIDGLVPVSRLDGQLLSSSAGATALQTHIREVLG